MGRPIKVDLTANVKDFARGMKEAATAAVTTAKEVSRAGQDMGKGITTGATPAITGFRAQFRGLGGQLRGVGRDAAGQFSQSFGQGLISSGGNPAQALKTAFASVLPVLGPLGIGAAIGVELVTGYLDALDKRNSLLTEAGRKLIQAQAAGMMDQAQVYNYLQGLTGKDNIGEALVAVGQAAKDAGVPVETLVSALLDGNAEVVSLTRQINANTVTGGSAAIQLLSAAGKARYNGANAARAQDQIDRSISKSLQKQAAESTKSADAAERAAAAARGQVTPMYEVETSAAHTAEAIHLNRREMVLNRLAAGEWAGFLADGKLTAEEFRPVQAFEGDNLARALHMMDRWDNLQDKQLMLNVMVSYEDARRIFSNGGAGVAVP